MLMAVLNKPLGLTGVRDKFSVYSHTLKAGRYPLQRVPNPFGHDADWFVLIDSEIGMAAGMWLDSDFQRFADFRLEGELDQ